MLPSDSLQNFTQPQSTTNAESAPDVEVEKKKESMNSALTSTEPQNSSKEYMASYSRRKDDNISACTRKRMDEKKRIEKKEKIEEKTKEMIEEIRAKEKPSVEIQEKDDIGGEFSLFPCCKEIDNPEELFEHIKKHHDKDATQCALCGKELSSKSSLDRHLLIHAKWQPYQCSHCNKQFSTNGNMHRHKKTHRVFHKASKLLKEDVAPNEDITSFKKMKKDLMQSKSEEDLFFRTKIEFVVNKRKMRSKTAITELPAPKKTKLDCSSEHVENVEQMNQTEFIEPVTAKIEMPDLDPHINNSVQELGNYNSNSNLNLLSPSKQEFIATLGLRNVSKSEESQLSANVSHISVPDLNEESMDVKSLTESYPDLKKPSLEGKDFPSETKNVPEPVEKETIEDIGDRKLVIDIMKEQEDLADITSILFNMKSQQKVVTPLKVKEESELEPDVCSNSVSNIDSCSFLKSKEIDTGISSSSGISNELKFFIPKDDPQQHREFVCNCCQKDFENKYSLQKHMIKHGKPKPFKCNECGAKLLNKPNAIRHVVKVHKIKRGVAKTMIDYNLEDVPSTGTKTVCEWCGKDFTSNLILEHHKRALAGCRAKPFLCLLCNKSFSTKNNGRRHQAQYHKDKLENCIVANTNVNSNANESVESNQSSASNTVSETSEISNNDSERNDSSSNSSESSLNRESLPSEDLAAARVLLDLYMHTSKNDSIEQHELKKDDLQTDISVALDSICSFNSNTNETLQSCPLDLSLRPMDLRKNFEKEFPARKCVSDSFLNFHNIYMSPRKEIEHRPSFSNIERENVCSPEAPLNLVKRNSFVMNMEPSSSFISQSSCIESQRLGDLYLSPLQDLPKNRSQNSSVVEDTKLQCDFCSISFANNSNKRRHEKKKHQLHGQETTPVHFSQECSESKKSKSVLSEKTKEAIISKVSLKPSLAAVDYSTNGNSTLINSLGSLSSESESGDLASVSSLINTANSPQLKKYLTTDTPCDVIMNQELTAEKIAEVDVATKSTFQKLEGKKVADKHWCSACKKEFTCKSSFNRHFVIHTKERNFHCSECSKTFTVKSNRDRHLKKIHKIFTQVDQKNLMAGKRPQNKSDSEVPDEVAMDLDVKDLTLPKDMLQCNKENQRLFMPS